MDRKIRRDFVILPTMSFSQHIKSPDDLKALSMEELGALAQELRSSIIEAVSTKEGHLGASLGVV